MSEAERRKRQDYKANRKKWILIQTIALAVLCVVALGSFYLYGKMSEEYFIEYTENGSIDYKVQYKENSFFEEEWIDKGQSYVSSLVNGIATTFKYKLNMGASDVAFDYSYDVIAHLVVSDKKTGDHIFDPMDELLAEKTKSVNGSRGFTINEIVNVDFAKYNSLAYNFITAYGLKNATAMLVVSMKVDVVSKCDSFSNNNVNSYTISMNVPLLEENFSIHSTASAPSGETKVLACNGTVSQKALLIVAIVAGVLAGILTIVLVVFIYVTRNEHINYSIKIKKILNSYRSFVQEIDGEFDTTGYQIVPIKTFNEMLGIRDTIQSPLLMWQNFDETLTQFLIPTDTKLLYTFEIRVENYDLIYGLDDGVGTVLEVEDENGVEEAIIVEKDANIEEVAAALATPDVKLEDVDFVPDKDVDYEGTEDAPGVEVVGVVWPERAHRNKVYRYDPNGENLNEGDMVLVPTRDAAKDREVIRKAAIAHGNHTIDPALHPYTLKKIIGVIKRHAEAALTPKDDNKE